ncbi:Vps51/Vps67 [Metarhizium album ARSEF 1941]|uniref:Conserved oligomeric Golgi complex subunit 1 n=1 Tax=Metarhizium album (strain ARSEF 1941) TaxID=1081103 RepID=A0A0B2X5Q4_METAS|nr:Vps51/Vps67 [Metarhizium album ARSEF 1941]KHO00750.1 Vps51/Vps67 [Metarhizium album ARSEF 1941]
MASAPDPTTLTSSADIFSGTHTLPQIRSIHNSLHVHIGEKAARLRTQVGGSYRELLGTADTIVHMRDDNSRVQDLLGKMGARCGRSVISSKASGLGKFVTRNKGPEAIETARLKLVESCGLAVARILKGGAGVDEHMKKGDRLVLATKVFVIGRLLVKSLREEASSEHVQQAADAAGKMSESLRRRIQRNIERLLENADDTTDTEDVVKALCAHSLADSSGAKRAIWLFLRVRQRAVETALDLEESERTTGAEDVIRSLRLYTKTLLDVQALVPVKLSQALSGLKSYTLLADAALRKLECLRLDIYERWCSDEIRDFTPFIKHDDLDGKQAREMLGTFAERGGQVVISGLQRTLDHMMDFKSITDLRTRVLQLWIRDGGRAKGFDPQVLQDELREAINTRLLAVVEIKATRLRLVGSEVKATLEGWQRGVSDESHGLWDDKGYDAALSHGATPFIQEVVSRLYGRNDAVSRATHSYGSWFHIIDDVETVVEQLRKQRWDNDYDEIEDEETIEARQKMLSQEDPKELQEKLDTTLDKAFQDLQHQLQDLWRHYSEHESGGAMAIYLIRVLRDIRTRLPDRPAIKDFGISLVPSLHNQVAVMASKSATEEFISSGLSDKSVALKPLWEGEPAMPSQPSPAVFQLLRDLSLSMTDLGVDLWTPAATAAMKGLLMAKLCAAWRKELDGLSTDATPSGGHDDGNEEKKDADEEEKPKESVTADTGDICAQWLFDIALLRCCIATGEGVHDFEELDGQVYDKSGLDEAARKKINKMAQDFWGRVNLLFGFLA